VTAQARDEGLGEPMAERRLGVKTPALEAAPAQPGHFGRGAGLIDEDQPMRLLAHAGLALGRPVRAPVGHRGVLVRWPAAFYGMARPHRR
jgi:hypothetical protein